MRKIEDVIIWLGILVFFCWYIPTSYMNVFACDDYWFGTYIHDIGFWQTQVQFYTNWEGSYTHTFLASLPHIIQGSKIPFLCNILSLSILIYAIYTFISTFIRIEKKHAIHTSLYLTSLLLVATSGDSEVRFWVCANFTYLPELAFVLIFIAKYHQLYNGKNSLSNRTLTLLLIIAIAGSKLTFIALASIGIFTHDLICKRNIDKTMLVVYTALVIFTLTNILAPGNLIRLNDEHINNEEIIRNFTLMGNITRRLKIQISVLLYSFFVIPVVVKLLDDIKFSKRTLCYSLLAIISGFIIESIIMHICFGDPGPKRIYVAYDLTLIIFMMMACGATIKQFKAVHKTVLSLVTGIIFIAMNIPFINQVENSIKYSRLAQERDKIVATANKEETIFLPELPESHLILSYFSNDIVWIENVYLPYFNRSNKVILQNTNEIE